MHSYSPPLITPKGVKTIWKPILWWFLKEYKTVQINNELEPIYMYIHCRNGCGYYAHFSPCATAWTTRSASQWTLYTNVSQTMNIIINIESFIIINGYMIYVEIYFSAYLTHMNWYMQLNEWIYGELIDNMQLNSQFCSHYWLYLILHYDFFHTYFMQNCMLFHYHAVLLWFQEKSFWWGRERVSQCKLLLCTFDITNIVF